MKTEKLIGWLLIAGAVLIFIPYILLTILFQYPDILREAPGVILTRFHDGGAALILLWWAFALAGLPLLAAYVALGQKLETKSPLVRIATTLGVISGAVQIAGLLRWTFAVPGIAATFVESQSEAAREAAIVVFQTLHQYGGVAIGECLGQLLTIAWIALMSFVFDRLRLMPRWVTWLGYAAAAIYLLAQAELLGTVIPGFPVWDLAGFIGSTLWLVWLLVIGVRFLKLKID
ncbi:MAG: DUF4386 domain-containing protein [bacterium]